jgi:Sec-independent protein translocase protein TatA
MKLHSFLSVVTLSLSLAITSAFVLPSSIRGTGAGFTTTRSPFGSIGGKTDTTSRHLPVSVERQRKSVGVVQTMGLFGLGIPEILIIVVAIGFVLGPEKIGGLLRGSGQKANELKEELKAVPKEFKKGLEEGEADARARKARPMKNISKESADNEKE